MRGRALPRPRVLATCAMLLSGACAGRGTAMAGLPAGYRCVPFHDAAYRGGPQRIPGRVQSEYYDMLDVPDAQKASGAEEGLCYHDSDNKNSGSGPGALNGVGSYLNELRMFESADISYTKLHRTGAAIDDSPYNLTAPDSNSAYLGWIAPGEWVNYTVHVAEPGFYSLGALYTSKFGGHISLDVNGKDVTGPLAIPATFAAADTIEWRQAHHWNRVSGLGRFHLSAGTQVLTLHFIDQPVLNFDYLEFTRVP